MSLPAHCLPLRGRCRAAAEGVALGDDALSPRQFYEMYRLAVAYTFYRQSIALGD